VNRWVYFNIKSHILIELIWILVWIFALQFMYFINEESWSEIGFFMLVIAAAGSLIRIYLSHQRNKKQDLLIYSGVLLFKGYKADLQLNQFLFFKSIVVSAWAEQGYHRMTVYSYMFASKDWEYLLKEAKKQG